MRQVFPRTTVTKSTQCTIITLDLFDALALSLGLSEQWTQYVRCFSEYNYNQEIEENKSAKTVVLKYTDKIGWGHDHQFTLSKDDYLKVKEMYDFYELVSKWNPSHLTMTSIDVIKANETTSSISMEIKKD